MATARSLLAEERALDAEENPERGDKMTDEGYFPTIKFVNWNAILVRNSKDEAMGEINWSDEWNCYVFKPYGYGDQFGPAFLANLASQMIRLEAQKRKENDRRPPL